ncbi:MAG TPA: T9SS type A sorting domain-containing protein, partial [Bacteroidia bacterium]
PSLNIVNDTIKTSEYKFNVILFPNPSFKNQLITVRIESNSSHPFNFEITGMDGRRIMDGQLPKSGSSSMDLNTLADGLYYFIIKDIDGNVVHKQYFVLQ